MQLPLQDFAALVRTQAAAVQGVARGLIDLSVGSVLRAVLEANASVGLWIQWLIVEVLATTRAATSSGVDLDSWVADFGLVRLPGIPARGLATFSRAVTGFVSRVPAGTLVKTGTGTDALSFAVVADDGHPAWSGSGYALPAAALSVTVPVVALAAGRAGNVRAGEMRLLASAVPGVDVVTNEAPAAGGLDAETDAALRVRFGGFIDSRTRATAQAVGFAVQGLQQGLSFAIAERVDSAGAIRPGHFTVTIDDGSGGASAALLAAAGAAIEAVRPIGGTFSVRAPLVVRVDVGLRIVGPADALAAIRAVIGAYVAALPIGAGLGVSRLIQLAHDAHPGVVRVFDVTLNGVGADLTPPLHGVIRANSVVVSA